jgi:ABC-type glycerol-3-phosphate transport system substrate-binding protein
VGKVTIPRLTSKTTAWSLTWVIWAIVLLQVLGCGPSPDTSPPRTISYTFDAPTRELIQLLAQGTKSSVYKDFDRSFKGLLVPESLLPYEPFVLGLSTESKIPTVLLLDAPWVQRYGVARWLYELERTQVFDRTELVPSVADAFSVPLPHLTGREKKQLVAVPTSIKGNILFYRRDILKRYNLAPPQTWEELQAICRKVLPQEKSLKYGLLIHSTNTLNDFYPILWGFGGRVTDAAGQFVLPEKNHAAAFVAALKAVVAMQGTIIPGPGALKQFDPGGSLRQAFYQGQTLFMINWSTRMKDLSDLIAKGPGPGSLTSISQVGVAPIPAQAGHPHRYSNIGSFGWAVNRFSVTDPEVIQSAKRFIGVVAGEQFQLLAAETMGQVPSLIRVLEKVTNKEVLQVYDDTFAQKDMVMRPRPHSRRINNVLEKVIDAALYGRQTPEAALAAAIAELKKDQTPN